MALSGLADTLSSKVLNYNNMLTDAIKIPAFNVTLGGKSLKELSDRLLSLSFTDNRGFDAD